MSSTTLNGFLELGKDMEAMAKMASPSVVKAALHEGGEIIVEAVKAEIQPHNRTGNLEESIAHEYQPATNTEAIGWLGDGYYGRFMETGFTARSGRYIDEPAPHMRPGYEKSKEAALDAMHRVIDAAAKTSN